MRDTTVYIVTAKRRGAAALIAMMYLIIFATMAVGFYASTNINSIVAHSENDAAFALASAESGSDFMRYQLANITTPYGTNATNLMANTALALGSQLNGTPNMGSNTVSVAAGAINIPSANGWITLDPKLKTRFRATITQKPGSSTLICTVRGGSASTTITRGIRMEYKPSFRSHVLIGMSGVTMSGSAFTDSYNSSNGAYSAATAGKNGHIASNGNITLSNTAKVNGDARPGPFKAVTLNDSATVSGLKLPMATAIAYPSVVLPAGVTDLGDVSHNSGIHNVPGGTYLIRNLTLSGTAVINWQGPVTLYIQNSYTVKDSVTINTYQNKPANRAIYFLPTCTVATWTGANSCVGDLYAPDTNFTVSGSVQKFGRIIAKSITNSSTGGMHADDALPQPGGMSSYSPDAATYEEVK
jgi:Tfp pilus assembly protein PilX